METMPLENKKTEWQACFPLRVPFNRTGEIQSLEERAVFTKQVYVSSKVFDLHEIPQCWNALLPWVVLVLSGSFTFLEETLIEIC